LWGFKGAGDEGRHCLTYTIRIKFPQKRLITKGKDAFGTEIQNEGPSRRRTNTALQPQECNNSKNVEANASLKKSGKEKEGSTRKRKSRSRAIEEFGGSC